MATDITLTSSIRTNLLSLQNTASLIGRTQNRLSTGKNVNSSLDNAQAFFTAAGLSNRGTDLANLKNTMDQSISQLTSATKGIDSITKMVEQAKALATAAQSTTDTAQQTKLASQYNTLVTAINQLAYDASYGGKNLVNGTSASLVVTFDEFASHKLTISGVRLDASGLTMQTITAANWTDSATVESGIAQVDAGLKSLRAQASTFGSNNSVLQIRLDFTKNLVMTLEEGAAKLVNADINEESANLLALQTRQQLGITSLSLANQSEQSILKLF
ncbi:MAG: flagellin [Alphaproteobacteria bacterium]|nr:flagellin [Alphaproteobacteria bacterium]MBF0356001.1 flagellin [Alphaproteobacteria bacterium]